MLRSKDINKISELKNGFTQGWLEPDFIKSSLKSFSFTTLCNSLNPLKIKGYGVEFVLSILISLTFKGINTVNSMFGHYLNNQMEAGKDVFYRLKNNPNVGWRLLLWLFANKFRAIVGSKSDAGNVNNQLKCMVFDDTILAKTGRFIENISRVWDHVVKRSVLGFKLLVMGYWDGTSFIPVDFSLHREFGKNKEKPYGLKKKELKRQYRKKRDKGSFSHERVMEVDMSKIDMAVKMFKRAIAQGFRVDYVLMDSWFTCDAFIDAVLKVKGQMVNLIGMYKIAKTKFLYKSQEYTYSQIRNLLGKPKRCRSLGLYYNEAIVDYNGKEIKLFFSKQGKNGKWKVLVSTDTNLSFRKMIEIYQIRWTIEVFFKESKQLLGLGKCQSNDFDAQIADITINMIQFTVLTLRYRFEKYESKGKLFSQIKADTLEEKLSIRLWGLFIELLKLIEIIFEDIDLDELVEKIFLNEQAYQKLANLLNIPDDLKEAA
jgi:predicted nucleic acid-binding Zn finger protein